MKVNLLSLAVAATVLGLAACDSKQENQREKTLEKKADAHENAADATRKASEKQADQLDKTNDAAAKAVRKDGEAKADAHEDAAKATREQK